MSRYCGVYSPDDPAPASEAVLTRMMGAIEYRGGQARRTHLNATHGVALGYLYQPSFLAPGQAATPAWVDDGTVVALDGSLNPSEAVTAEQAASPARSAAAISALYTAGGQFPEGLDGYFSFALWDPVGRRVCLANDRLGNRPLYYYVEPGRRIFVFASELKALLEHPSVKRQVDLEALVAYLARGYVPGPRCLFMGVRKATAGQVVSFDAAEGLEARSYWQAKPAAPRPGSLEEWGQATRTVITAALSRVTNRTPRLGVQFSGGIDSSIVAAALRDAGHSHVECFTIAWPDAATSDDAAWSRRVAEDLGLKLHIVEAGPEQMTPELVSRLLRQFDEPVDSAARAVGLHYLSEAAKAAGFDSIVNGSDGEQLFIAPIGSDIGEGETQEDGGLSKLEGDLIKGRYFSGEQLRRTLVTPPDSLREQMQSFVHSIRELTPAGELSEVFSGAYFLRAPLGRYGAFGELIPALSGVESRRGFRDYELFEFSRTIPHEIKGSKKAGTPRNLLRAAFGAEIPATFERTEKSGSPGTFSQTPVLQPYFIDLVRRAKDLGLFHPKAIDRLLLRSQEAPGAKAAERIRVMALFLTWHAFYIEGRDPFEAMSLPPEPA